MSGEVVDSVGNTYEERSASEPSETELDRVYNGPAEDWDGDTGEDAPAGSFQMLHVWRAGRASRDDDLTTAHMAGFHSRDGEVEALKAEKSQLTRERNELLYLRTDLRNAQHDLVELRAALESAKAETEMLQAVREELQRFDDDMRGGSESEVVRAVCAELAQLRANSTRAAAELLLAHGADPKRTTPMLATPRYWAEWLKEQQSASQAQPDPEREQLKVFGDAIRALLEKWRIEQGSYPEETDERALFAARCLSMCRRELRAALINALSSEHIEEGEVERA